MVERLAKEKEEAEEKWRSELAERLTTADEKEKERVKELEQAREELAAARTRVDRLESYLGGELPDQGVTWREERETLIERITVCMLHMYISSPSHYGHT